MLPINFLPSNSARWDAIIPAIEYRKAIYEKAVYNGYTVIDGFGLGMPNRLDEFGYQMLGEYDGVHPTENGHQLIARSLCGKLL
jgi:lysophospholipase L1-like esterase